MQKDIYLVVREIINEDIKKLAKSGYQLEADLTTSYKQYPGYNPNKGEVMPAYIDSSLYGKGKIYADISFIKDTLKNNNNEGRLISIPRTLEEKILFIVCHELTHARQNALFESAFKSKKLTSYVIFASAIIYFNRMLILNYPDLYTQSHDLFNTERDANIKGLIRTLNYYDDNEIEPIIDLIKSGYDVVNGKIFSPLDILYSETGKAKELKEIFSNVMNHQKNIPLLERSILGTEISIDEYQQLDKYKKSSIKVLSKCI